MLSDITLVKMAKGKGKFKRKRCGVLRQFLDALLSCCGRRKRRDQSERECGHIQDIPVIDSDHTDGREVKTRSEMVGTSDDRIKTSWDVAEKNSNNHLMRHGRQTEDESSVLCPAIEIDGFIELPGLGVPRWLQEYRRHMLLPVVDKLRRFEEMFTLFFQQLYGVDRDAIKVKTRFAGEVSAVVLTHEDLSVCMIVTADGEVKYSQGRWDNARQDWQTQTYVETFGGLRLVQ